MKTILTLFTLLAMMFYPALGFAQNGEKALQAEMVRSTTGRAVDSSGLANAPVPLRKGALYEVVRRENGNLVLKVGEQDVQVESGAVKVSEKGPAVATKTNGFVPGKIILVSAKYSLDGNQPTNVKNNLQKLIPQGVITAPVKIIVSDGLSIAAQDQGNVTNGTVVSNGNGSANFYMRTSSANVLTVKYVYNGQEFTKQVPEGKVLVLP